MSKLKQIFKRETLVAMVVFGFALVGFAWVVDQGNYTAQVIAGFVMFVSLAEQLLRDIQ